MALKPILSGFEQISIADLFNPFRTKTPKYLFPSKPNQELYFIIKLATQISVYVCHVQISKTVYVCECVFDKIKYEHVRPSFPI